MLVRPNLSEKFRQDASREMLLFYHVTTSFRNLKLQFEV